MDDFGAPMYLLAWLLGVLKARSKNPKPPINCRKSNSYLLLSGKYERQNRKSNIA